MEQVRRCGFADGGINKNVIFEIGILDAI